MKRPLSIAFVNARPNIGGLNLRGIPFAYNVLQLLAEEGHYIDVYLGEHDMEDYNPLLCFKSVRLRRFPFSSDWLYRKSIDWVTRRMTQRRKYQLVFGVGQIGSIWAYALSRASACHLVLFNDEFPSSYPKTNWTIAEARALIDADITIVPDKIRLAQLISEVPGLTSENVLELPNSPLDVSVAKINWRERLGLSSTAQYCVHVGGIGHVYKTLDLLQCVKQWEHGNYLVMRVFPRTLMSKVHSLGKCDARVIWLTTKLEESELNALLVQSNYSLAVYGDLGEATNSIGRSSGKLMRSLALGVPVIASRLEGFEFVEQSRLGYLIDDVSQITQIISDKGQNIGNSIDRPPRCEFHFRTYWQEFREKLEALLAS